MADSVVMMEQFVGAGDIDSKDLKCPRCSSKSFVLIGNSQVGRKEDWQQGECIHTDLDKLHVFEIEIVECLACMTRSRIKSNEYMLLESQNLALRQRLIALGEADPFGEGTSKPS